jgi:NAD(P)H-dependent flavin oxidoreductase YrpB (nitropropane dioxygenase family)
LHYRSPGRIKMQNRLQKHLGFQSPIFAFSHCRNVVAEVTKAGGFGVLGASTFSPEQLEVELAWIDEQVGDLPYGVDVIIPVKYDRDAEAAFGKKDLNDLIPDTHKAFMKDFLDAEGVPELPQEEKTRVHDEIASGRGGMTPEGARRLLDVVVHHPKIRVVVSALGAPPEDVVRDLRHRGIVIGAMCGKPKHASRQYAAGVDFVVAQGTEAGGHTGAISTLVLVPDVIDAVKNEIPVIAAGGFARGSQIAAALAMGAEGVWCGTVWLGTRESELTPFEKQAYFAAEAEDAVRRRCRTGKTVRMLKSRLSEIWEAPDAPEYLDPPLQGVLFNEVTARVIRAERSDLYSFPAGQVVGSMKQETSVRQVMLEMQTELADALERLQTLGQG